MCKQGVTMCHHGLCGTCTYISSVSPLPSVHPSTTHPCPYPTIYQTSPLPSHPPLHPPTHPPFLPTHPPTPPSIDPFDNNYCIRFVCLLETEMVSHFPAQERATQKTDSKADSSVQSPHRRYATCSAAQSGEGVGGRKSRQTPCRRLSPERVAISQADLGGWGF